MTASDAATGDMFGASVAISGSTAVVGAPYKSSDAGAAYVFVRSGSTWSQKAKLSATGGAAGDEFGYSVAIYGSTAVIGAPYKNSSTGAAYVFVKPSGGWSSGTPTQTPLSATDGAGGDYFGRSVAIYGSRVVVGALGKNSYTGAAYVFVKPSGGWSSGTPTQTELTVSGGAGGDAFGASVAISGSTAVVGAYGENSDTGAAYVFVHSSTGWSQQTELTASDGASEDLFGYRVAVSGSTAVIGALGRNSATGAAYVFARVGTTWSQQAELTASDGAAGDEFGSSVAISGSTAVIGALYKSSDTGAAYVFTRSGSTWSQQAELTASRAAGGQFGSSVAISGSTAVVGAPYRSSNTGSAYVFVLPSQQAELTGSDAAAGDQFGYSVAISGSTAVVGENSSTGAAYVFAHTKTGWHQQAKLTASDAAAGDSFGFSVAISGSTAVIGAPGKNSSTGAAYVFVKPSGGWSSGTPTQKKLTATGGAAGDSFGFSVAISGSTAVVGAAFKSSSRGAAYVFVKPSGGWSSGTPTQKKLTAADGAAGDTFGHSVAISGSTAVIGAPDRSSGTGAAYVFAKSGSTWSPQAELTDPDAAAGDYFGHSVAISGSTALISAWGKNSNMGATYVFVRSGTAWSRQAELTASDAAAGDAFGTSVAISGSTAVIGAYGKNSSTGAAYVFTRSGVTWAQQAELTASDAAAGDSFGGNYYTGNAVGISGTTAVIGAFGKNSNTGAAYAFGNL